MGKKLQGAKLRARKRAQAAVEELQEQQAAAAAESGVVNRPDEALFVIDTEGNGAVPPATTTIPKEKKRKTTSLSAKDEAQVAKLVQRHSPETLQRMAAEGRKAQPAVLQTRGIRRDTKAPKFDLWGDDSGNSKKTKKRKSKRAAQKSSSLALSTSSSNTSTQLALPTPGIGGSLAGTAPMHAMTRAKKVSAPPKEAVAVEVAQAGQSYQPDPVKHAETLHQAAQIEVRRQNALKYLRAPLAKGLSKETKALMVGDSSDEEESDTEDNNVEDVPVGDLPLRTNKLTRAQRNKQKRLRKEQLLQDLKKRDAKLMKQVGEVGRYQKEIHRTQHETNKKRKDMVATAAATKRPLGTQVETRESLQDPVRAPTYPVALDVASSLRTLRPKGSLLTDRLESLADRQLLIKRAGKKEGKKYTHTKNNKRRKLSVRGKRNRETVGATFVIKG